MTKHLSISNLIGGALLGSTLLTGTVVAAGTGDDYRAVFDGNPDVVGKRDYYHDHERIPATTNQIGRYHGVADGNPDLIPDRSASFDPTQIGMRPDIYGPFGVANPDLSY
ncbi:MAG: hypothetical protein EA400_16210 [Chromatiaceae bacterium]|jgi:hypothetical protein|nr:MAG: hypothetical protein EA400_16210 [Chromatiaceae bacterium]